MKTNKQLPKVHVPPWMAQLTCCLCNGQQAGVGVMKPLDPREFGNCDIIIYALCADHLAHPDAALIERVLQDACNPQNRN